MGICNDITSRGMVKKPAGILPATLPNRMQFGHINPMANANAVSLSCHPLGLVAASINFYLASPARLVESLSPFHLLAAQLPFSDDPPRIPSPLTSKSVVITYDACITLTFRDALRLLLKGSQC